MEAPKVVTACVLIIGNEILSGRTQDSNLNYIAKGLGEAGVRLKEARVIPDVAEVIVAAVNEMRAKYDYVFTTGGIGPTHDDITSECVARAFGVPWIVHPEARLRMARTPEGAELVRNPVSRAPGFRMGNVFVMAGVPEVMRVMFDGVKAELKGGAPVRSRAISCNLAEGVLAQGLGEIQKRHPEIDIGSYPRYVRGGYAVTLVARGTDAGLLDQVAAEIVALIDSLGGVPSEE